MLDIAFELIGEATSNSLLMFCFCNLIIVMIITGSLKPSSMDSQDSTFITSGSFNMYKIAADNHDCGDDEEEDMTVVALSSEKEESFINASIVSEEVEEGRESCHFCDDEDADDGHDDNEEDDADDDNEDDGHDDTEEDDADDDNEDGKEAEVEEEEGDDDDLRKRVEEFIAKINNEWRHDKLRALNLVY